MLYATRLLFSLVVFTTAPCYAQVSQTVSAYLDLDGDSLYYEVSGDGFPLVLVAGGSGMGIYQWSRVVPELEKTYRVIQVEPRGIGRSSNPTSRYSDATDLKRLFEHLGLDRLVLIGLSSAGGIVLEHALQYPDRLAGVVAVSPFVPGFQFSQEMLARLAVFTAAGEEGKEPFLDSMFDDPHFIPAPLDQSVRAGARANMGRNYDKGAGFDPSLVIPLEPPLIEQLDGIRSPTLLMVGALDHSEVLRRNRFLVQKIPDSSEQVVASAGHNIPLENPKGFLKAVGPFLQTLISSD